MTTEPTKVRLARVLQENGCPQDMVQAALEGFYDDFESPLDTPCVRLVMDLRKLHKFALAKRAENGEFDGTKAEADAWMEREGMGLLLDQKGRN